MTRARALFIPLVILVSSSAQTASGASSKAETLEISGGFRYQHRFVCDFRLRAESNEDYLVCDTTADGIRWQLRARAEPQSHKQTLMQMELSRIEADSRIHVWSSPSVMILNGSESSIVESSTNASNQLQEQFRLVIGADI